MELERNNLTNILDLNDYELLDVLKYLNSTDLWQLNKTCLRFHYLVRTRKLWRRLELRDSPFCEEKIKFAFNHSGELTRDVRLCAQERFLEILPKHFEMYLIKTNLTILALENQKINGENVKLRDFPDTLLELSLKKTFVISGRLFFERSNEKMINLKVIILDHCFWLESIMLVHMSKYESLEYLSLYKCKRMSDSDMAYISLAGRFGFNKLRVLDCRFSGLGDQVLRVLYTKVNLREIYFENYLTTYYLEKARREFDISNNGEIKKYSYLSEYDDIMMFDKKTIEYYYGNITYCKKGNFDTVSDDGTLVYRFTECFKDDSATEINSYKSILYKSPYKKCNCNKKENLNHLIKNKGPTNKMKSLKKREMIKIEEEINKEIEIATSTDNKTIRISHLLSLPPSENKNPPNFDINQEGDIKNHFSDWIHHREPKNLYEMAMLENSDLNPPMHSCEEFVFSLSDNNHYNRGGPSNQNQENHNEEDTKKTNFKRKRKNSDDLSPSGGGKRKEQDAGKPRELYVLVDAMVNRFGAPTKRQVGLKMVSLRGFKRVTDKTLESFAHLDLELIDVTFTKVTEDGLKDFVLLNPNCRVVHESLCRCRPRMHF